MPANRRDSWSGQHTDLRHDLLSVASDRKNGRSELPLVKNAKKREALVSTSGDEVSAEIGTGSVADTGPMTANRRWCWSVQHTDLHLDLLPIKDRKNGRVELPLVKNAEKKSQS